LTTAVNDRGDNELFLWATRLPHRILAISSAPSCERKVWQELKRCIGRDHSGRKRRHRGQVKIFRQGE
jgi:hypothetical protein